MFKAQLQVNSVEAGLQNQPAKKTIRLFQGLDTKADYAAICLFTCILHTWLKREIY